MVENEHSEVVGDLASQTCGHRLKNLRHTRVGNDGGIDLQKKLGSISNPPPLRCRGNRLCWGMLSHGPKSIWRNPLVAQMMAD
jgi:hypothetical protein